MLRLMLRLDLDHLHGGGHLGREVPRHMSPHEQEVLPSQVHLLRHFPLRQPGITTLVRIQGRGDAWQQLDQHEMKSHNKET